MPAPLEAYERIIGIGLGAEGLSAKFRVLPAAAISLLALCFSSRNSLTTGGAAVVAGPTGCCATSISTVGSDCFDRCGRIFFGTARLRIIRHATPDFSLDR